VTPRGFVRVTIVRVKGARRLWPDLLPAVVLTAAGIAMTLDPPSGQKTVWDTILVPTVTFPVFWWRRAPFAAAVAIALGMVVSGIPTFDQLRCGFALPGAMLILFGLGSRDERDRGLIGLAAVEAGVVFLMFTDPQLDLGGAFILVLAAGVWGAGRFYRSRTKVAAELSERTRDLEDTREEAAQLAAEVERAKVAADLDVAARDRIRMVVEMARDGETAPRPSSQDFERIEREGRESLNQMRELLGVLRSDERDTSPRPTLAQLETLLERARAGGRAIDLRVEGSRRPLPTGVELAAYRVVQHSLEAFGVGDGDPATVRLRYRDRGLELEVTGATPGERLEEAALDAARERVSAHGGAFSATEQAGGMTLVRAELPLAVPSGG
jgi:signal transduction histidine kinase